MKLFVGNLSWEATEEALRPLFEAHGTVVSVRIIQDPFTGRSKGYGFVEMADDASGEAAMNQLNEFQLLGRPLRVSAARTPEPRGDRGGDRGERRGGPRGPRSGGNRPFRGGGNRFED